MSVRAATPDDVPAVLALDQALFGADAWSTAVATAELTDPARSAVVACAEGGSVIGYAVTRTVADVVDLHRIAVAPDHRRTGLGSALLDEVRRAARSEGATRLLLEVSVGNPGALAFYAAEGFTRIHRRPGYYRDGSDALVLQAGVGAPACGGTPR